MIHILVADEHTIIRAGLKFVIEELLPHSKVDEAKDGNAALEKITEHPYELLMLEVNMPGKDSCELVSNILSLRADQRIIVFSMYDESVYAAGYLKIGVRGYLQKDAGPEEIIRAVTMVLNNKKYVSPRLSQSLIENLNNKKTANPFDKLSARELEIAQHLIRGESVAEICKKLALQPSTVGTHKIRIFRKLGCSNVIALNSLANAHNYFS